MTSISKGLTIVTLAISLVGCGDSGTKGRSAADFAGIAFDFKRSNLESNGFLCKDETNKEGKVSINCVSFASGIEVLGRVVKERNVTFDSESKIVGIQAVFDPKYSKMNETIALERDLSKVYSAATDLEEFSSSEGGVKNWRRPDGSVVRLVTLRLGMRGLIDDKVTLTVFNSGIGEQGWKKDK